jgi:transcriptional regulator with XRE-family HTH domain
MYTRFKTIMSALELKNKELAKELGITPAAVSDITNGRVKKISGSILIILKLKFKVNPDWLLTGEGEMFLTSPPGSHSQGRKEETPASKVMQNDADNENKNGLSGVDGGAEIFEGELNHTRWFRNLSPKKKVIAAALEELTEEGADRVVQGINYELRIEESRKVALRQKGEAG